MSVTKQIDRSHWKEYFDRFSKRYLRDNQPEAVTIDFLSAELGDQKSAEGAQLLGITYDPKAESLEVLLENVDHLVFRPEEIWAEEEPDGFLSSLEIVRADDEKEILTVRRAGLPAPS